MRDTFQMISLAIFDKAKVVILKLLTWRDIEKLSSSVPSRYYLCPCTIWLRMSLCVTNDANSCLWSKKPIIVADSTEKESTPS